MTTLILPTGMALSDMSNCSHYYKGFHMYIVRQKKTVNIGMLIIQLNMCVISITALYPWSIRSKLIQSSSVCSDQQKHVVAVAFSISISLHLQGFLLLFQWVGTQSKI